MPAQPPVPVGRVEMVALGRGRRMNVWRAGEQGPVVLLVHGIPTNHLLWYDVVPALAQSAQVIAVDLLGFGWSSAPRDAGVDLSWQSAHLLDLLDTLGIDRAVVVGHDLGGGIAQILAVTSPDRVPGIAVIDGVCFDAWPVPAVRALKATWPAVRRTRPHVLAAGLERALRAVFVHDAPREAFVPRFVGPWTGDDGPERLVRQLRWLDSAFTEAVAPFLPRLRLPVEVLWARRDSQMKARYGEQLAAVIPTAELTWVEDSEHFLPAEAPHAVVEVVQRLLARVGGGG